MDLITPEQGRSEQEATRKSSLELMLQHCGTATLAGEAKPPLIHGQAPRVGKAQGSRLPPAHRLPPGNESRQESLRLCNREPGSGKREPALLGLLLMFPRTAGAEQGERPPAAPGTQQGREHVGVPMPQNQHRTQHEGCCSWGKPCCQSTLRLAKPKTIPKTDKAADVEGDWHPKCPS